MEKPQVLPSFLVSFPNGRAVLPSSVVVESLPFATPLHMENAPPWVIGAILWRTRTTPLVSLNTLIEGTSANLGAHSRIIVLNALGSNPQLPNFGILGTETPYSINLERAHVTFDEIPEVLMPEGVLMRVRINDESVIIPDLDFIEEVLGTVMRRKSAA